MHAIFLLAGRVQHTSDLVWRWWVFHRGGVEWMDTRYRQDSIERVECYHDPRFGLTVGASTDVWTIGIPNWYEILIHVVLKPGSKRAGLLAMECSLSW